uniref:AG2 protein n=1 Tax=Streptomyces sp. NBC_01401 TaxID=2903854 RepID=A0AAU3H6K6_9ACTN
MVGKLEQLAADAADGMKAKADKADWDGLNAGVTKGFITKTAKEFKDAAAEAKGVKLILEEGYAAIKKARDELIDIRDRDAPAVGIHVNSMGKVTARNPAGDIPYEQRRHDPDYPELVRREKAALKAWQAKIDLIVDNCNDADVSLKNSLEANVTDRKDFAAPKYKSLDQEEAARAYEYALKGRGITHTELQAFNELMHDNSNSPEFSKAFYGKLGPEQSLTFFGQVSETAYPYGHVDKERLKDVQALQKNLGLNLATASQDKAFTAEWGPELRKLGTERIPMAKNDYGGPFGYQLLGGIMRYGNYDAKFLNPIAEHVAQLHQKDPDMFAESKVMNARNNPYNPSGVNGAGYDPTVSMLEALGNSPDAAKHFFADPPTAYNEDGTVNHGATADLGKKGGEAIGNYLDFFGNEKWEDFGDVNTNRADELKESRGYMPDALGHALEAATLGYPVGHPDAGVVRDADNAAVMEQVMQKYGEDAKLLEDPRGGMADSLGVMGAGYIDDINWAMDKNGDDSVFAPGKNPDGHMDFLDTEDGDGRGIARKFLSVLGHHPDAYASVSAAEQVYTGSVLEAQVNADGDIDAGDARRAVRIGSGVQGVLDQARADEIEANNLKTHEEYEKAAENRSGWAEFGGTAMLGAGVATAAFYLPAAPAIGAGALLVPIFTDTGVGAVEQFTGDLLGGVGEKAIDENKEEMDDLTVTEKYAVYTAGEAYTETPVDDFVSRHKEAIDRLDAGTKGSLAEDLNDSRLIGYQDGNLRARVQGTGPAA